jgi:hypothetical protein
MSELKKCPFCGSENIDVVDSCICYCDSCGGCVEQGKEYGWNTRPLEDEKDARIAMLESQLAANEWIPDSMIDNFAELNGAHEVHRSWRDNMLEQSRSVSKERMDWDTLSEQDKALDYLISRDVIRDFVIWLKHESRIQEAQNG